MDEINFLSEKSEKKKKEKQEREKINWSEPAKEKAVVQSKLRAPKKPGKLSGWLAFLKKEKKFLPPEEAREKVKSSRQAVLRAIKAEEGKRAAPREEKVKKEGKSALFLWWKRLFGKRDQPEVMVDYQPASREDRSGKKISVKPPLISREVPFRPEKTDRFIKRESRDKTETILEKKEEKPDLIQKQGAEERKPSPPISQEKRQGKGGFRVLETNLLKGEIVALFQFKKNLTLFIFSVVSACLIIAGVYGGLSLLEGKKEEPSINRERLDNLNKEARQIEEEVQDILFLKDNLKLVAKLLDSHIYWTNFFRFLEDNIIENVYYDGGISFASGGEYSLSARAKDFKTILNQVNIMRLNDYVEEVKVTGGKVSMEQEAASEAEKEEGEKEITSGVDFGLKFSIDPLLFTKGPRIFNIEPLAGPAGQYFTISGINFRLYEKGKSSVKFYNSQSDIYIDADTNFPQECRDNWWHNSYIVAKVPAIQLGAWQVIVTNEEGEALYSTNFQVTDGSAGPGICLLEPSYGFEEQVINIYGDNFGQKRGLGGVEYYDKVEGKIISWSGEKVTAGAPLKVQSGVLKVKTDSGKMSNGLLYKRLY